MLNATRLVNAMPVVAAVFARSAGLTLHFYDGVPKTDGKNVWLPHVPFDASEDLRMLLLGALAHEVGGHVVNTDFSVIPTLASKGDLALGLLNAVEDPRIERCAVRQRPGTREWLESSLEVLRKKGMLRKTDNPADTLILYIILHGMTSNGMQGETFSLMPDLRDALKGYITESGVNKLDGLLANAWATMNNTQDAADVVTDILELLKKIEKDQKKEQKKQQKQQQDQAQGQPQGGQGAGQQNGQGQGNTQGQPQGGQGGQPQPQPTGAGQVLGATPTITHLQDKAGQLAKDLAAKEVKDAASSKSGGSGGAGPKLTTRDFDRGATLTGAPTFQKKDVSRLTRLRAAISASVARLVERLEQKVTELRQETENLGKRGRLHSGRVVRALVGDANIFKKKMVEEWRELSMSIVVDCSPSMRGSREESASSGLIAMAQACERLEIPLEVCAFGSPVVQYIKTFDEPLREAMPKFGALDKALGGSTPMAEGVLAAAVNLSLRPEPRKVLFLITDGDADNPDAVRQVVARIRDEIEVIGLGIETKSVAALFPEHALISGTNEVGPALIRLVAKHLADVA